MSIPVPEPAPLDFSAIQRRYDTKKYWRSIVLNDPCAYCQQAPSAEVDHITPNAHDLLGHRAERNTWTNYTGSCRRCNRQKKAKTALAAFTGLPIGPNAEHLTRGIHYDVGYRLPQSRMSAKAA